VNRSVHQVQAPSLAFDRDVGDRWRVKLAVARVVHAGDLQLAVYSELNSIEGLLAALKGGRVLRRL